jgi:SRSO17 transposase
MKHHQHTTLLGSRTTPSEVCGWAQALTYLHARIAPRFARPEPRRRALAYLQGILSSIERKNGWQLAEHAREATPYGMQRLLSQAVWDADGVRDDLRTYALEQLGQESTILVIDETSFPKRGEKSAGVGVQYCGTTGQVENCQVGVFLSYVTARGHTLIDRELYLLAEWAQDHERRQQAGIPARVRFQTKPDLARCMLQRVWEAQIPIAWVVGDSVYGENLDLRTWLQAHGYAYVLEVHCDEAVGIMAPDGRRRQVHVADVPALLLSEQSWQRLAMSEGTKGPRWFDWACVPILPHWQQDGQHWLLFRRSVTDAHDLRYYLVFGPPTTTLQQMVHASGGRWHIEEDFANAKDMGLDHYQVRSWIGWYRHVTLVMLAHAFLTGICAQLEAPSLACSATSIQEASEHESSAVLPPLLSLTVPEVRRLLGHLIWPAVTSVTLVLAWSWWRRWHRSWASYYHRQRRLQAQARARSP